MIKTYPSTYYGIKSVQRGSTASAGSITIASVDVLKTFVRSYSTGSTGTVNTDGNEQGSLVPNGGSCSTTGNGANAGGSWPTYSGTRTFAGGTTALWSREFGVYLTNSTTLTATGACRWEVIEYY